MLKAKGKIRPGGAGAGWGASALPPALPWLPPSSQAVPRFSGDVYTCVVGAKSWLLLPQNLSLFLDAGFDPTLVPTFYTAKELFDHYWKAKRQAVASHATHLPDQVMLHFMGMPPRCHAVTRSGPFFSNATTPLWRTLACTLS